MISLLPLIAILLATAQEVPVSAPVFPPPVSERDVARLLQATAFVRGLDESALVKLVPRQSGLNFVGCPNCDQGRQENQLDWSPEQIDEVSCRYCKHRYPSAQYPMNKAVTVRNPRGEPQRYPYWENAQGYRYFFAAKRDDQMREYLAARARDLALLSVATGEKAHARRAALLLDQFAQVFPGWCYHYDYPFRQKEIDDGNVPPRSSDAATAPRAGPGGPTATSPRNSSRPTTGFAPAASWPTSPVRGVSTFPRGSSTTCFATRPIR